MTIDDIREAKKSGSLEKLAEKATLDDVDNVLFEINNIQEIIDENRILLAELYGEIKKKRVAEVEVKKPKRKKK